MVGLCSLESQKQVRNIPPQRCHLFLQQALSLLVPWSCLSCKRSVALASCLGINFAVKGCTVWLMQDNN